MRASGRQAGDVSNYLRVARVAAIAVLGMLQAGLAGALVLSDGPGGASCQYFGSAGNLAWDHAGGDWVDMAGTLLGGDAFSTAEVRPRGVGQVVLWDVTALAQAWQGSSVPAGSMLLRAVRGVVNFNSRENADRASRPSLVVTWSDGQIDRLEPSADTYFPCPSYGSFGSEVIFKVSADWHAMLVFPFRARPGFTVRSAALRLVSDQQYGAGATVEVFGLHLPQAPKAMFAMGPGLAAGTLQDRGLEDKSGVLYVQRFGGIGWLAFMSDLRTFDNLRQVDAGAANGFRPLDGSALAVTIKRGDRLALNHQIRFSSLIGHDPEEAYFRYYLRLGDNWDPVVDGGKLPGFAGTYGRAGWGLRPADGTNGWTARGGFFSVSAADAKASDLRGVGTYADVANSPDYNGSTWGWNLGPTGLLHKNRWYSIEQRVKMNTPGKRDGVLQVWIDGKPAFSKTDIEFRTVPALKIESVWMNVYFGGTGIPDRDMTLYIDNLVIARHYIGPGNFPR